MNKQFSLLLMVVTVFSLVFTGCDNRPEEIIVYDAKNLEAAPDDFKIRWFNSGGMSPESSKIQVLEGKSYIERTGYEDGENLYKRWLTPFDVTDGEMAYLYDLVKKNKFESIKTHEEEIFDRGGESMRIWYDKKEISRSDAGMSVISDKVSAKKFYNITDELKDFVSKKTVNKTGNFVIQPDDGKELFESDLTVMLDGKFLNDDWYFRDGRLDVKTTKGKHELKAIWKMLVVDEETGPGGKFVDLEASKTISVPWDKGVRIYLKDSEVLIDRL